MTDDKINQLLVKHFPATHESITPAERFFFMEGYMALLNELEPCATVAVDKAARFRRSQMTSGVWKLSDGKHNLYSLPEGVEKP